MSRIFSQTGYEIIITWFVLQDETPLFLAAREGSFESAKILLDHYANRDITDHMDRLPRDIAENRQHGDILRLLDEYRMSPAGMTLSNGMPASPGHIHMMQQKNSKQKRRKNNSNTPISPNGLLNAVHPKKAKAKKKSPKHGTSPNCDGSASSMETVSPGNSIESPLRYDQTPNSYDMYQAHSLSQQPMYHINNVTMSHSMTDDKAILSYDYNNSPSLQPQWTQPHHNPPPTYSTSITPPSQPPINSPMGHGKMSPVKPPKMMLPTSPTHIQAMQQRALQEQRAAHGSPHSRQNEHYMYNSSETHHPITSKPNMFTNDSYVHQSQAIDYPQKMFVEKFPTPQSQSSMDSPQLRSGVTIPDHYLTPSPDSPGQWSSSSPHSAHSDWSEGISSPDQPNRNKPVYL